MMTPEPIPEPFDALTFTSTTDGLTFAITASRTACRLLPVSAGTVAAGVEPVCSDPEPGVAVAVPLLPNCQPANKPTPKIKTSTRVSAVIAPVRILPPGRLGFTGGITGGVWNSPGVS